MGPSIALSASHITKSFGSRLAMPWEPLLPGREKETKPVVDDVSLSIAHREIYDVVGANGSGKSTLVRILSTLILPDGGEVRIFGRDAVRNPMAARSLINRVSADPSFFRSMSLEENLLFFGRIYGLSRREVEERSPEILRRLGLEKDLAVVPMRQLSRGQQQKAAVARCFLTSPVLLLLDEPTTGLDPRSKREVQEFIGKVRDQHDATILLCTHDMHEAELLCDRVAFLVRGRLIAEGTPLALREAVAQGRPVEGVDMETVFMEISGRSIEDNDRPETEMIDV